MGAVRKALLNLNCNTARVNTDYFTIFLTLTLGQTRGHIMGCPLLVVVLQLALQPAAGSLQAGLLAPVPVWVHGLRIYILLIYVIMINGSIRCEFTARVSGGGMGVSPSRLREVPQGVRVCEKSGLG